LFLSYCLHSLSIFLHFLHCFIYTVCYFSLYEFVMLYTAIFTQKSVFHFPTFGQFSNCVKYLHLLNTNDNFHYLYSFSFHPTIYIPAFSQTNQLVQCLDNFSVFIPTLCTNMFHNNHYHYRRHHRIVITTTTTTTIIIIIIIVVVVVVVVVSST